MTMNTEITFTWATPFTAPQNSTSYNLAKTSGDPERFDDESAAEFVRKNYLSKVDFDNEQIRIGGIWFIDEDGEEVVKQEPTTSGHDWI